MKRFWVILVLGAMLGVAAYATVYAIRTNTHRQLGTTAGEELAWLQREFKLSEDEFETVKRLHEAYKPVCAEMCRRIDAKSEALADLLGRSDRVTPEVDRTVGEVATLTKECRVKMLEHFFEVSRAMPPEQGRRYLLWMQQQTLTPAHPSMTVQNSQPAHGHEH